MKNKLTIQEVYKLFKEADAISIDDSPLLTYWDVGDIENDDTNDIVSTSYICDEQSSDCVFTEHSLKNSVISNGGLNLIDREGDEAKVVFFKLTNLLNLLILK